MTQRSKRLRDAARKRLKQANAGCSICGHPIDYDLPYLDPGEFVVDHVIPLSRGGTDTPENQAGCHRSCNANKGSRLDGGTILRRSSSLSRTP